LVICSIPCVFVFFSLLCPSGGRAMRTFVLSFPLIGPCSHGFCIYLLTDCLTEGNFLFFPFPGGPPEKLALMVTTISFVFFFFRFVRTCNPPVLVFFLSSVLFVLIFLFVFVSAPYESFFFYAVLLLSGSFGGCVAPFFFFPFLHPNTWGFS